MSDPRHEEWTLLLSDYLNGDLAEDEARSVEAHLTECASCRGVLADLRELVAQAGALGEVLPSRDLWPAIAQATRPPVEGGAQVIAFPGQGLGRRTSGLFLTGRQLAAASVVLVFVSAAATWFAGSRLAPAAGPAAVAAPSVVTMVDDAGAPPPDLVGELAALEAVLTEARGRLDPNTVRILEKNLGVIQRAIDESAQALAVDPSNAFLRDHLERAYREKAAFLREVTTIVDWEG